MTIPEANKAFTANNKKSCSLLACTDAASCTSEAYAARHKIQHAAFSGALEHINKQDAYSGPAPFRKVKVALANSIQLCCMPCGCSTSDSWPTFFFGMPLEMKAVYPLSILHRILILKQGASPGPAPQMATRSPFPTPPSSVACQAVGSTSDSSTTFLSDMPSGTFRQFRSATQQIG